MRVEGQNHVALDGAERWGGGEGRRAGDPGALGSWEERGEGHTPLGGQFCSFDGSI